jgi:3-oxoacyl-[acyl-carrier protein] reductase
LDTDSGLCTFSRYYQFKGGRFVECSNVVFLEQVRAERIRSFARGIASTRQQNPPTLTQSNQTRGTLEEFMAAKLAGKVAVVTGASKGLGAEIARQLASEGAAVVVNYSSSKAGADKVVADITAKGGKAIAVQGDMSKPADVIRLFAETKKAYSRLDVLVNNAGIYQFAPLDKITPEHFHQHFDLNVLGLLLATQEAAKHFGPAGGSVVNISSVVATASFPGASVYSATKAAVDSITRTLAAELGPRKIRVNSVNPGMVVTEGNAEAGDPNSDFAKGYVAAAKLGRVGHPDDIAPAVVYFATDDSKWVTGETLFVTGGFR